MIPAAAASAKSLQSRDFWLSSGYRLLEREEGGGLVVTEAFLRAYFNRAELSPGPRASAVERALHAALLAEPRRPVERGAIEQIADPDARMRWQDTLAFRDRLLRHRTLESTYLALVRRGVGATPPLFVNHLVHVVLRNLLDNCTDPHVLRAAELFFRPQRLAVHEGSLIAVDAELVDGEIAQAAFPLVAVPRRPAGNIDVLADSNAESYWRRSDSFDMALNLHAGGKGRQALGEVMRRWLAHLLALEVAVEPVAAPRDGKYGWIVGLDAEGARIASALAKGDSPDEATMARIACLFSMTFSDDADILDSARGEPVHLMLGMAPDGGLRMKPQNLIAGLPLRRARALL